MWEVKMPPTLGVWTPMNLQSPCFFFVGLKQKLPPPSLNFSDVVPNLFVVPYSFLQTWRVFGWGPDSLGSLRTCKSASLIAGCGPYKCLMAIFGGAHLAFDSARGSSGPGAVCFFFFSVLLFFLVCVWFVTFFGVFPFCCICFWRIIVGYRRRSKKSCVPLLSEKHP